jgi:sugar lactone lactonase YvrE
VAPSALLRVGADGSVAAAADGLLVANGMALTPDGGTLIVAESAGRRLTAFGVGADGALSDRRVWADLPDGCYPDGICLDAEGAVWVGAVVARRFIRVVEGGAVTDVIPVEDDRFAVACVLGGDDRRTLYLLTAATTGEAEPSRAMRAARVEQVRVAVPGAGLP